ncbi:class I tRNA ligase family protein [Candidatus Parcubacteria bacterium]|nr:class I tRNA ligase family protein [Candidatus Parcubacteria bacterium]
MPKELPKAYEPRKYEDKIYKTWEESGFFNPDNLSGEPYSIMMPPPNVTGILHLGHALENTLMDIMARYQRMNNKKTLLLPGTDHAAVATQARVEKLLIKQGIKNPRQELGRDELLKRIRKYADESKSTIIKQIKKMGTSCDWSRLAYTFDDKRSEAVNKVFVRMYKDGLIYQGHRVVNWSVKGQSTCSDDELEHKEQKTILYTFKYSKDFPIAISTTRPETKFGDTAVAVHPDDARYKKYIGKIFTVNVGAKKPLNIKIIADKAVDSEFGTGAVGVTPAHSQIDYDMYEKHKLDLVQVIGEDGCMTEGAGKEYEGLSVDKAREKFVAWLRQEKLIEAEEEITHNVGTSDRFGDTIEVLPMKQWFVAVNKEIPNKDKSLKDLMREAVASGLNGDKKKKINITPDRFNNQYYHWIDNLRDWCISRQIWWGHRIPVWYKTDGRQQTADGSNIYVGIEAPKEKYNKAVLLHAWDSKPDAAFFPWLKQKFESRGIEVLALALPNSKNPNFNDWLNEFEKIKTDEQTIVIGRSLGATLALGAATRGKRMGKLISVCTPLDNPAIPEFFKEMGKLDYKKIKNNIKECSVIHSSDDPYIEKKVSEKLSKELGVKMTIVDNAGHFAGGKYDEILDACGLWTQDEDTLDTWFSSGLWTFSTLGWPRESEDLKTYHPSSWMQMGYEILFFWMARMILFSTYALDDIPFKNVYIHGMLRSKDGKKFSKSLGNGIDPIEMSKQYGTDALRLSLILGTTPGNDSRFYEEKVEGTRNLINKLWNVARYILQTADSRQQTTDIDLKNLTVADQWILANFNTLIDKNVTSVTKFLDRYDFSLAATLLQTFTLDFFADWYLEVSKFEKSEEKEKILLYILKNLLKLWHPFVPFVTEAIWQEMGEKKFLMVENWPNNLMDYGNGDDFELIKDIITAVRNARAENKVEPVKKIKAIVYAGKQKELIKSQANIIKGLRTGIEELEVKEKGKKPDKAIFVSVGEIEIYLIGAIDEEKEKKRLKDSIERLKQLIKITESKLDDKNFVERAPEPIVNKERARLKEFKEEVKSLEEQLARNI